MDLDDEGQCRRWQAMSPEIVEIDEDSKSVVVSRDGTRNDVYVAVGKNDLHVVKWALDHAVSPGSHVFLVHVFPPMSYIPTPVGRLSRSQLSNEQLQVYIREESNRRKHLLEKYVRLCNESKIAVETMLVESKAADKAILELISVAYISSLVMGTRRSQFTRLSMKGIGKGEYVKKHAPEFCEVTLVCDNTQMKQDIVPGKLDCSASSRMPQDIRHSKWNLSKYVCFLSNVT